MASDGQFQSYIQRTLPKSIDSLEEKDLVEMVKKCETKVALTTIYYISRDITVRVNLVKGRAIPLLLESLAEENKKYMQKRIGGHGSLMFLL